jgi:ubiquinone/menaquinone biosynthesis C-methylase UbiE
MSNFDENSEMQKYWNEEGGNKWAENIDAVESVLIPMSDKLLEQVAAKSGDLVMDVGCGGGITSIKLAEQVGESGKVLAIDVSEQIIAIGKSRGAAISNLDFHLGDAATVNLGDAEFDLITSRFGVMFFDDPIAAFSNMHRALKTSGRLVFLCWRTIEENPWLGEPAAAAFEILPPPADADMPDPTSPGPFSLGNPEHLKNILESAGFNNIDLQSVDMNMPMGHMDDAVPFLMKLGPAADAVKEATDEEKAAVAVAIRKIMEKYDTSNGVCAPSATWIVKASK